LNNFNLQNSQFEKFLNQLLKENSHLIDNLTISMKSFLIAEIFKKFKKNILVITSHNDTDKLFLSLNSLLNENIIELPSDEIELANQTYSSHDIIGKRFETLKKISDQNKTHVILCPYTSFIQKITPKSHLKKLFKEYAVGQEIDFENLEKTFKQLGYQPNTIVSDKGQFAIRGGIVDIFPAHMPDPYRIEFFGDTIDSIRIFDPIGQKSIEKKESFLLTPANELKILNESKSYVSILDYLDENTLVVYEDLLEIEDAYAQYKKIQDRLRLCFDFHELIEKSSHNTKLFLSTNAINELTQVTFLNEKSDKLSFAIFEHQFFAKKSNLSFLKINDYLPLTALDDIYSILSEVKEPNFQVYFLIENEQERKTIEDKLTKPSFKFTFIQGYLNEGFVIADINSAIIPYVEFTKQKRIRRQKWRNTYHNFVNEFYDLKINDLVVHFHSGIGKYIGVEKQKTHDGTEKEFMVIEFAENSKLYVPLNQSHLVSRYIGSDDSLPTLNKLGSKKWQTTKINAQKQILGYASDLLKMYAEREIEGGYLFPKDSALTVKFENEFPYIETPDQLIAIREIKIDMMSDNAMDRLLCGDVGYGKTEVAIRAAFKAVIDGEKQVAILVPTTVLATQHFESFQERFNQYPVNIEVISRFKSVKETKEILQKTKANKIDILIGTHRLLSKDVSFANLGLIIIDEEQRFGVRAKEHLKNLKKGVDCLTLSATPIPRTLYMSLINIRNMSTINTPPQDRLPINLIVAERDDEIIKSALLREIVRGGQAFFIHNRVESIHLQAKKIKELIPDAKIAIVHGQMSSSEIDQVFHSFKLGQIQILIATTIIESGIDIPNANTILIDRADTYGLADLYQLKGRVGRWNKSAFAYFLVPKNKQLTEIAKKRLNALIEAGSYGAGMKIAMRDLQIRGAGDILGVKQSGQISAIGFHLYCKLLKNTVNALKNKKPIHFIETKMEFPFSAYIPENYIKPSSIRMELYQRFGNATSFLETDNLIQEIKDRFGKYPVEISWLHALTKIRIFASNNQFSQLKFGKFTLQARQQIGKKIIDKQMPHSNDLDNPIKVEIEILNLLKNNFQIKVENL
jgi:transcription-repair coupling factor (superfamily II helicase)